MSGVSVTRGLMTRDNNVARGRYDSEYDNYSRAGHVTSDAESDFPNEDLDSDVGQVTNHSTAAGHVTSCSPLIGCRCWTS